ncbi:MAG TPA: hypothetical protein PK076_05995 [Saprospiraceae bacterium]|nr:hypothetical protein [Saprospiraceae bacterium]HQW55657.1 hypothetical protein [Saprospiraceae bacterium]
MKYRMNSLLQVKSMVFLSFIFWLPFMGQAQVEQTPKEKESYTNPSINNRAAPPRYEHRGDRRGGDQCTCRECQHKMNMQAHQGPMMTPEEGAMNINRYRKLRNTGIGLMIGGAVVTGAGIGILAYSFVKKDKEGEYKFTDSPDPILAIAGSGTALLGSAALTSGTVLTIVSSIKMNRTRSAMRDMGTLDLQSGRNGLGLCLRF